MRYLTRLFVKPSRYRWNILRPIQRKRSKRARRVVFSLKGKPKKVCRKIRGTSQNVRGWPVLF